MAEVSASMAAEIHSLSIAGIEETPFPARSKAVAGLVGGAETDVSSIYFSDKIMITISQSGRLSQWVCNQRLLAIFLIPMLTPN